MCLLKKPPGSQHRVLLYSLYLTLITPISELYRHSFSLLINSSQQGLNSGMSFQGDNPHPHTEGQETESCRQTEEALGLTLQGVSMQHLVKPCEATGVGSQDRGGTWDRSGPTNTRIQLSSRCGREGSLQPKMPLFVPAPGRFLAEG